MRAFSSRKPTPGVKRRHQWWLAWGLVVALGLALGNWQWQRAGEKREALAVLASAPTLESPESAPPAGARVRLHGTFHGELARHLDNRIVDGRAGVAVLTPLLDTAGRWWLVDRGFVPVDGYRHTPAVATPDGLVTVEGRWQGLQGGSGDAPAAPGWLQHVDPAAWEPIRFAHAGWLHQQAGDGLLTPWWVANVMPPSRHIGYALQWWGLALAAAVVMWKGRPRLERRTGKEERRDDL